MVHAMRYGARDEGLDRAEDDDVQHLEITNDQIVAERFRRSTWLPTCFPVPKTACGRLPQVAVPRSPGVYLAGDWVGPSGWPLDDGQRRSTPYFARRRGARGGSVYLPEDRVNSGIGNGRPRHLRGWSVRA